MRCVPALATNAPATPALFTYRDAFYFDRLCQVVEEARRRLLEQHGAAVEGYLPKGSLKSRDELELVRDLSSKKHMETNRSDAVGRYLSSPLPGDHR